VQTNELVGTMNTTGNWEVRKAENIDSKSESAHLACYRSKSCALHRFGVFALTVCFLFPVFAGANLFLLCLLTCCTKKKDTIENATDKSETGLLKK